MPAEAAWLTPTCASGTCIAGPGHNEINVAAGTGIQCPHRSDVTVAPGSEIQWLASGAMIVRMGRAQKTGSDSPVDKRPDMHVTGALPASMTSFIGRSRELDELRSLFRGGKTACHPGRHRRYR